jgi:hypothetical protein
MLCIGEDEFVLVLLDVGEGNSAAVGGGVGESGVGFPVGHDLVGRRVNRVRQREDEEDVKAKKADDGRKSGGESGGVRSRPSGTLFRQKLANSTRCFPASEGGSATRDGGEQKGKRTAKISFASFSTSSIG